MRFWLCRLNRSGSSVPSKGHRAWDASLVVRDDSRIRHDAYTPTFVRSLIMVPIGKPVSVAALGAYWSEVRTHNRYTVKRLESLASLVTIAIGNARLTEARNRAAATWDSQNRILKSSVEDTLLDGGWTRLFTR